METESRRRKRRRDKKRGQAPSQKIIVEDFSQTEHDFFQVGETPAAPATIDDGFDLAADPQSPRERRKVRVRRGAAAAVLGGGLCVAVVAWVSTSGSGKLETSMVQASAANEPAKAEAPAPPKVELPAAMPKIETPAAVVQAEAPAPKVEAPAPKVEAPAPKVEAPAPKVEAPVAAAPKVEPPKPAAKAEVPAAGNDARAVTKQALRSFERGNLAAALDAGQKAIALDPSDAQAWLVVGAVQQQRGNDAAARKTYKSCAVQARRGPVEECAALSASSR